MRNPLPIFKDAAYDWWDDNCMRLAASLSYYTALSIAPLIVIAVGVAGLLWARGDVSHEMVGQMRGLMGEQGAELTQNILDASADQKAGTIATIIGIVTLIFGATAVFGELQAAMNLIWEVKPKPIEGFMANVWAWLKERFFSLTMVLGVAFLLLVSLVISAGLASATNVLGGEGEEKAAVGHVLSLLVSIPVITLLFAVLYKYLPDAKIPWRDVWVGALVSAVLFTLGKFAIGFYLGHASVGSAYGAAGSLVVLLVWVYYSSLIFFFGAEFTQAWAKHTHPVQPKAHAEPGATPQQKGRPATA
jgi:membrane protein